MKLTILSPENKVISDTEKQIELPTCITSFVDNHPIINIDEEEAAALKDGCKALVNYLIDH